jgi:hypothetical protein
MNPDFRLEEHPLILLKPRIVPPYGWVGHIPFAYLAIDLLRPRRLVELGTHSGNSYLAFCQAAGALKLACQFRAVDDWRGDEHALRYGEQIYQSLRSRHDPLYGEFSQLLRARFDDAVGQFDDGSIDLLHIDGLHTYEAVRHDFESWLPKLSDRAVVLLHDTEVHEREFGVARFFDELAMRYPCFGFRQSHGLGVVAVGENVPAPFLAFLRQADAAPAALRGFFEVLAATLVDADDRPVQAALVEPHPVVCHLYYRTHAEAYDEGRMISQPVDATDGVVDLQFRLPVGQRADYLRLDPCDLAGVYRLSELTLRQGSNGSPKSLDDLSARMGHLNGELLPDPSLRSLRLVSFDGDPHVEFEIDSVLGEWRGDEALELSIRVEYEVVVSDPVLHGLLEKQSASLTGMRQLARERVNVQSLSGEFTRQREELRALSVEFTRQREDLRVLSSEFTRQRENLQGLAGHAQAVQSSLQGVQQGIDVLSKRSFWSWLRRRC